MAASRNRLWPRRPTPIAPSGASWQFSGDAGISTNSSAFTFGNPNAPDGNQVAFIKDTSSMSQSVFMPSGVYNISFMAAQRDCTSPATSRSRSWSMAR